MAVRSPLDSCHFPATRLTAITGWSLFHSMVRVLPSTMSEVHTPGMLARYSAGSLTRAVMSVWPPVPKAVLVTFFQSSGSGRLASGVRSGSMPTPST